MARRRKSDAERWQIVGAVAAGESYTSIAARLGITKGEISRLVAKHRVTGDVKDRPRQGRPKVTNAREDRAIAQYSVRNRFVPARLIRDRLQGVIGRVSRQTINNRLLAAQLPSRRPRKKPELTPQHRQHRLRYARDHVNWNVRRLRRLMWTDEKRFCLYKNDGRDRVRRRRGEAFQEDCLRLVPAQGRRSIMVWAGFTYNHKIDLVVIQGTMTAANYRDAVLCDVILPFQRAHPEEDFILVDDNAPVHRARVVTAYELANNITTIDWPARSPDLNVIEHAWDMLQRAVRAREPAPNTLAELADAVREEWTRLDQNKLRRLVRSVPNRCREVIQARGGSTHY